DKTGAFQLSASRLSSLQRRFKEHCRQLGVSNEYESWFRTSPADDGSMHVEVEGENINLIVTERGTEIERRETDDEGSALYLLMSSVTSDLALKFELRNRRPGEDFRRQYFAEQERRLRKLHDDW